MSIFLNFLMVVSYTVEAHAETVQSKFVSFVMYPGQMDEYDKNGRVIYNQQGEKIGIWTGKPVRVYGEQTADGFIKIHRASDSRFNGGNYLFKATQNDYRKNKEIKIYQDSSWKKVTQVIPLENKVNKSVENPAQQKVSSKSKKDIPHADEFASLSNPHAEEFANIDVKQMMKKHRAEKAGKVAKKPAVPHAEEFASLGNPHAEEFASIDVKQMMKKQGAKKAGKVAKKPAVPHAEEFASLGNPHAEEFANIDVKKMLKNNGVNQTSKPVKKQSSPHANEFAGNSNPHADEFANVKVKQTAKQNVTKEKATQKQATQKQTLKKETAKKYAAKKEIAKKVKSASHAEVDKVSTINKKAMKKQREQLKAATKDKCDVYNGSIEKALSGLKSWTKEDNKQFFAHIGKKATPGIMDPALYRSTMFVKSTKNKNQVVKKNMELCGNGKRTASLDNRKKLFWVNLMIGIAITNPKRSTTDKLTKHEKFSCAIKIAEKKVSKTKSLNISQFVDFKKKSNRKIIPDRVSRLCKYWHDKDKKLRQSPSSIDERANKGLASSGRRSNQRAIN